MLLLTSLILQFVATLMNLLFYQTGITAVPICYNNHFHLIFHPGETPVPPG